MFRTVLYERINRKVKLIYSILPIVLIGIYDINMNMNIKQLEIFVNIVSSGSFSKGAEATFITQSTASQHIAALESLCGVKLLDRTSRGAMLTEAGKIMLIKAQQVLMALKETEQAILQFSQADGVELSVGGSTIPGTYLLPKAIAALRASDPGINVTVEIGDSSEILAKLINGHIEIGVVGTVADNKQFTSEELGHDLILLVACKGHAWSGRAVVQPVELCTVPIVMREKGSGTNDVVATALRQHGVKTEELKVSATISSSEAIKQAVLADCGLAFVSELAVREELKQGKLVAINLAGLTITRSFSLVQRRGRTLSPAANAFSLILRQP